MAHQCKNPVAGSLWHINVSIQLQGYVDAAMRHDLDGRKRMMFHVFTLGSGSELGFKAAVNSCAFNDRSRECQIKGVEGSYDCLVTDTECLVTDKAASTVAKNSVFHARPIRF